MFAAVIIASLIDGCSIPVGCQEWRWMDFSSGPSDVPLSVWELLNCGPADEEPDPCACLLPADREAECGIIIAGRWGGGGAQLWPPSPVAV